MTTVIADTSPINYLILIREVEVLQRLFGEVLIPPAVHQELQGQGAPPEVLVWARELPAWTKVVAPKEIDASIELGRGETEAISLAREVGADVLLMDERQGRMAAKTRGIHTVGTVLLLGMAHEKGLLDFDHAVSRLQNTTFRVSADVVDAVRSAIFGASSPEGG